MSEPSLRIPQEYNVYRTGAVVVALLAAALMFHAVSIDRPDAAVFMLWYGGLHVLILYAAVKAMP